MEEPNVLLRWAMYHFAGGDSYLCGLIAIAACQLALLVVRVSRGRRWLTIGSALAFLWAIIAPPPVPIWVVSAFLLLQAAWVVGWWRNRRPAETAETRRPRRESVFRMVLAGLAAIGILCELPYRWFRVPEASVTSLCVVGDSITAGLNDGEDTWPRRLSRQVSTRIRDASQPGATLKSARRQVQLLEPLSSDYLVLEIGGNDLLEGLPLEQFELDMDQLLSECRLSGATVVMFELPLPPLSMRYGAIQRRLANRYQVRLIPRRYLMSVLTTPGSTVDGIHLSAAGQERLMRLLWNLLNFPEGTSAQGEYRHLDPPRTNG
jgi:acyl-CoA thioesterase-1